MARLLHAYGLGLALVSGFLGMLALAAAEVPCSEIAPADGQSSVPVEFMLVTDKNFTSSFFLTSSKNMTVELWAKLENLQLVEPSMPYAPALAELFYANYVPSSSSPRHIDVAVFAPSETIAGELELGLTFYGESMRLPLAGPPRSFGFWTHYAFVFDVDPANTTTTRVSFFVNGTLAAQRWTLNAPPSVWFAPPIAIPDRNLYWGFKTLLGRPWSSTVNYASVILNNFRVWGRALDQGEIASLRYRRIRAAADDYARDFPELKINLPLDFGSPGTLLTPSTSVVNDADCTPVSVQIGTGSHTTDPATGEVVYTPAPVYWVQSDHAFCSAFHGGVPAAGAAGCQCGQCFAAAPGGSAGTGGPSDSEPKCYPAPKDAALTTKYRITCPPNITISRVGPVDVNVSGVVKRLCGAQMPDLRFLIAGNWSDARVNITQHPKEGSFLPMHTNTAPTSPEWLAAGFDAPTPADGIPVSISIDNPTEAGPEGSCSFALSVREAAPPLCPGACPPPVLVLPVDPETCWNQNPISFPDLRRNLTLGRPDPECIPPVPVSFSDYVQESADGSDDAFLQPGAPAQPWTIPVRDVRIRHRDFLQGPACRVRVVSHYLQPNISWHPTFTRSSSVPFESTPMGIAEAVNSSVVAAMQLGDSASSCLFHGIVQRTELASCSYILMSQCQMRVRVEMNAKLGLAAPDVDAAGNFTFAPGKPAWSLRYGMATPGFVGTFSREVPDHYVANPNIAPGETLRTYFVHITCAFNKEVPAPAKPTQVSFSPYPIEIRKP
eukprot:tig00020629_g12420.t1